MGSLKVRYLVEKRGTTGADGTPARPRWFWQPAAVLRSAGWRTVRLATHCRDCQHALPNRQSLAACPGCGRPIDAATLRAWAVEQAEEKNRELDAWRQGAADGPDRAPREADDPAARPNTLAHVITLYKASTWFTRLSAKTRRDYEQHLTFLIAWAGDQPVRAIAPRDVDTLYETLAKKTPRKAQYVIQVLRRVLKFAHRQGKVSSNPASGAGIGAGAARLRVATHAEVAALWWAARRIGRPSIGDAVLWGCLLGQRQGDLLALECAATDDGRIRLRQSKRGAWIDAPLSPLLTLLLRRRRRAIAQEAAAIAAAPPQSVVARKPSEALILSEETGRAYRADNFRHLYADVREEAAKRCPSVADLRNQDLRDTAVTWLAQASATIPEICALSGHSERSVYDILRHYLALNSEMADSAIAKQIAWRDQRRERRRARKAQAA